MLKKKTTILFINSDGKRKKNVQVPNRILLHWKKYFVVVSLIFTILVSVLGFMVYEKTSKYYTLIYTEKLAKANRVKNMIDIEKAKESFQNIEDNVNRINEYLEKRGLIEYKIPHAGGETNFDITEINKIAASYEDNISEVAELVKTIPMGMPHNGKITSKFGYRVNPFTGRNKELHGGIDFRGKVGSPIRATASGKIIYAGYRGGYGNCVIISHDKKLKTLYAHMSAILVKKGENIEVGDTIGKLGNTGRSTGPHLHYEVYLNNKRINPESFLKIY